MLKDCLMSSVIFGCPLPVGGPAASRLAQCVLLICIEKGSYSELSIQVSKYHANVIVNHVNDMAIACHLKWYDISWND